MTRFINNDTVAVVILGIMGISAIFVKADIAVVTGVIGAVGGFIGATVIKNNKSK